MPDSTPSIIAIGQYIAVRAVVARLAARWRLVARLSVAVLGVLVVVIAQLPDIYVAEADVLLPFADQQGGNMPASSDPVVNAERVHTEVMLVQSQAVLRQTIATLGLQQNDEFGGAVAADTISLGSRLRMWLGGAAPARGLDASLAHAIAALATHLSVAQVGDTRVIKVVARAHAAAISAKIANTIVQQYLSQSLAAKVEAAAAMQKMLSDPLEELRSTARASEEALERYRRETGLVEVQDVPLVVREISGLTEQLALARAALAEVTSKAQESGSAEGSRIEVAVQTARAKSLEAELERLTVEYHRQLEARIHARELERDAAANEEMLRAFLDRYKQIQLQTMAERPGARVIAWADEPIVPTAPQRVLLLAVACVAAFGVATAAALQWPQRAAAVR